MKNWIRALVRTGAAVMVALACAGTTTAGGIITFLHEGSGRGTLDGEQFGANGFIITATADIGSRESFGSGFWIDHLSASITINGVGTFDFITATRTFVNNGGQIVGFSRAGDGGADLFNGPINAAFSAWDITTAIGPIAGDGGLLQWTLEDVVTTGGILVFDDAGSPATFTAIIPAPGALTLLGMSALIARRRRRE